MGLFKSIGKVAKGALGVIAPTIASALPGPLGGIAKKAVAEVLGIDPASDEAEIEKALATADPAKLIELKKVDADFKQRMKELEVDLEKVNAGDRASAREREVALRDWTPRALAFLVVGCWVGVQWFILTHVLPGGARDIVLRSFGIIEGAVVTILAYYFGSSHGSTRKTEIMNGGGK